MTAKELAIDGRAIGPEQPDRFNATVSEFLDKNP